MTLADVWEAMTENPWKAATGVLVVALLVGGVLALSQMVFTGIQQDFAASPAEDVRGGIPSGGEDGGSGAFVEVQEASYDVEADDADVAAGDAESVAQDFSGYVQSRSKRESDIRTTVSMTIRVPSAEFAAFNAAFRDRLDVSTYEVRNYRVSIQRQLDEIAVLNRTLNDYERIRERVLSEETTTENLELLATLTEKELWVTERLRYYQRELGESRQRADYATVDVTITADKAVDLAPEDIGSRFRKAVKDMLDAIVTITIDTVTGVLVLFLQVIQAIIYLAVILVPLAIAYRVGRRLYREYWPRK